MGLILHSATQLKEYAYGLSDPELLQAAEEKAADSLKCLYRYLKEWVGSQFVIGGSSFGGLRILCASQELKVLTV